MLMCSTWMVPSVQASEIFRNWRDGHTYLTRESMLIRYCRTANQFGCCLNTDGGHSFTYCRLSEGLSILPKTRVIFYLNKGCGRPQACNPLTLIAAILGYNYIMIQSGGVVRVEYCAESILIVIKITIVVSTSGCRSTLFSLIPVVQMALLILLGIRPANPFLLQSFFQLGTFVCP